MQAWFCLSAVAGLCNPSLTPKTLNSYVCRQWVCTLAHVHHGDQGGRAAVPVLSAVGGWNRGLEDKSQENLRKAFMASEYYSENKSTY